MPALPNDGAPTASEQELFYSQRVAKALWYFCAGLLALLAAWSSGPYWSA